MKKYSLTILFILLLGLIVSIKTIWAQPAPDYTTIVQDYPLLPACEGNTECRPGQGIFGLPQFVKYIFLFALGVVGIVALLGIIMGAFGYVTSAGNPQKAADSKEKIIAALLGLLLLLGSALILNMINPDLLKLKEAPAPPLTVYPIPYTPEEQGCRFLSASWNRGIINVGDRATLTFKFSEECRNLPLPWVRDWGDSKHLKQDRPGGWDPWCDVMLQDPASGTTDINNLTTSFVYTFNRHCTDKWGADECTNFYIPFFLPISINTYPICSFIKEQPEIFFIEGRIYPITGITQYVPRLRIQVRDLNADGGCCW